ncbi:hypothetical protein D9758_006876 [Tetrapyrgos nigripes]|uniref:Uncharacterized protein n=1 Tax=Tetrapyrgos nigripes TaxID=182062 RepID=A0A8H5LUR8_9AGAR|nr:hypothetical protein D9758_006876 [Tetrapyrgos nigripes]
MVLGHPSCSQPDFTTSPSNDVLLVMPRHAVQEQWNEDAICKHCKEKGCRLLICKASNTIQNKPLTMVERYALAICLGKQKSHKKMLDQLELAIRAKVLVTKNIKTDLDITNGARREIVDIVLDPHEPKHNDDRPVTHLKYLPLYILVKMKRTRAQKLAGLDKNVIPIEPTSQKIYLKIQRGKKIVSRTLIRKQFSMTSAYAFTDYRSQGQTILYVLIDIGKPPTGKLNLFNLYVALSPYGYCKTSSQKRC